MRRVVITGMGTVNPLGKNVEEFWANIKANKNGLSYVDQFDTENFPVKLALFVSLFAEKNVLDHDMRIWSAGCSFGNEPYNLAMCMDDYFGFDRRFWDLKILATDISLNALRSAKNGIYTSMSIKNIPEDWRKTS